MTGTLTTLNVLPTTDNASDLGSALLSYNDGWFDGTLTVATMAVSTVTCTGCVTSTNILDGTIVNADINSAAAIVITKLATFTSAELATQLTNETGSGSAVFATSPTLTTPTLGVATATTLDTGQGAYELYAMDQNVRSIDGVSFTTLDLNTAGLAWGDVNKSGSSLADLVTRSASDLSSGTLADARLEAIINVVTEVVSPLFTGALTGNVTGNVSGSSGSTTGNAATATILQTARNIAGQSFNGSASINIAVANLSDGSNVALLNAANVFTSTSGQTIYPATGVVTLTMRSDASTNASFKQNFVNSAGAVRLQFAGNSAIGDGFEWNSGDGTGNLMFLGRSGALTLNGKATVVHAGAELANFNSTATNGGYIVYEDDGVEKAYFGSALADIGVGDIDDLGIRSVSGGIVLDVAASHWVDAYIGGVFSTRTEAGSFKVLGAEAGAASLIIWADEGDDSGDKVEIKHYNSSNGQTSFLNAGGNVLFTIIDNEGIDTLSRNIDLSGGAFGTTTVGASVAIGNNASGSGAAGFISFNRLDSTQRMVWVDAAGDVRIGTAAPAADGSPSDTSGTVVGTQTSTLRTKTLTHRDLAPSIALSTILGTRIESFTYKSGAYNNTEFYGIIADWSPEFAMDNGRSFNPISAFGYTVQAFKAMQEQIDGLRAELAALRGGR